MRNECIAGARNLLQDCLGVEPGDRLLIVRERAATTYYDCAAAECVASVAEQIGAEVKIVWPELVESPKELPSALISAMTEATHTVFFSQIGDQVRFVPLAGASTKTMCYALNIDYLGSPMCTVPHSLMSEVQNRLLEAIRPGIEWDMRCPLGTNVSGVVPERVSEAGKFSLGLFPVMIFDPIGCHDMQGVVVLSRWLMSTATDRYQGADLNLDSPLTVDVKDNRINGFRGDAKVVRKVNNHYERVATLFGSDPYSIHSWHAGINPNTYFVGEADANMALWKGISFGSPRYTHFHTCGDNPGQIAWSLFDTTITLGGEVFWDRGRFVFLERPEINALISRHPQAAKHLSTHAHLGV